MASNNQHGGAQGTGKHPHKSTEEPYPRTREQGTQGHSGSSHSGSGQSGSSHSGSGHSGGSHSVSQAASHSGGGSHSGSSHSGSGQSGSHSGQGEADDLKQREYRDKDGNVHHHTRTSEAMRDKK